MALTDKQKIFCDEYLVDLNATRAYKVAYNRIKNDETAMVNGSKLLRNTKVAEYINKRKQDRVKRTEITQDMVLNELAAIAFAKASDYAKVIEKDTMIEVEGKMLPVLDENGEIVKYRTVEPILTDELTDTQKCALAIIKKGRDGFEVKAYDKIKALELLGKHIGMFTDKLELSGNVENPLSSFTTEELKKLIADD